MKRIGSVHESYQNIAIRRNWRHNARFGCLLLDNPSTGYVKQQLDTRILDSVCSSFVSPLNTMRQLVHGLASTTTATAALRPRNSTSYNMPPVVLDGVYMPIYAYAVLVSVSWTKITPSNQPTALTK